MAKGSNMLKIYFDNIEKAMINLRSSESKKCNDKQSMIEYLSSLINNSDIDDRITRLMNDSTFDFSKYSFHNLKNDGEPLTAEENQFLDSMMGLAAVSVLQDMDKKGHSDIPVKDFCIIALTKNPGLIKRIKF